MFICLELLDISRYDHVLYRPIAANLHRRFSIFDKILSNCATKILSKLHREIVPCKQYEEHYTLQMYLFRAGVTASDMSLHLSQRLTCLFCVFRRGLIFRAFAPQICLVAVERRHQSEREKWKFLNCSNYLTRFITRFIKGVRIRTHNPKTISKERAQCHHPEKTSVFLVMVKSSLGGSLLRLRSPRAGRLASFWLMV